ncbi:MAG: hypothetical protein D6795_15595 [Deltaproteobacteria bacterium]|nr:MAG: hypothetical protein D6795_15595 [Deltaproteobacteria bacterium]
MNEGREMAKAAFFSLLLIFAAACLRPSEQTTLLNTPPVVTSISVEGTQGDVTITFTIEDADEDSVSLLIEYQGGSRGSVFVSPSLIGNTVGLPPGTHSVLWQSARDEPGIRAGDYRIRITPFDTEAGTPRLSEPFFLDNNTPPSVISVAVDGVFGDVELSFTILDTEGDRSTLTLEYRGGTQGENFTPPTFEYEDETIDEETLAEGLLPGRYTVIWHSRIDEPQQQGDDFEFRISASDGKAGDPVLSKKFSLFPGISIDGSVGDLLFDDQRQTLYLTNIDRGRVEAFRLVRDHLEAGGTFEVLSLPSGLAQTPDHNRLYVCNRGSTRISVIDLVSETIREIVVPEEEGDENRPDRIAISGNVALFSTTFSGTGRQGTIRRLDLATERITPLSGIDAVTESTLLTGAGPFVVIAPRNDPEGNLYLYRTAEETLISAGGGVTGIGNIRAVTLAPDASLLYVANEARSTGEPGITGLNPNLERLLQIPIDTSAVVFDPNGRLAYAATFDLESRIGAVTKLDNGRPTGIQTPIGLERAVREDGLRITPDGRFLIALLTRTRNPGKDEIILLPPPEE